MEAKDIRWRRKQKWQEDYHAKKKKRIKQNYRNQYSCEEGIQRPTLMAIGDYK